ncbi:hypothetical protein Cfor_00287 [Coptotermes formosanus]|uniref:CCHC-type domain-containing protein n=1 Tax=Coptotermes formosanus TaxID=36987 RepID=A0A6L2PGW1_COPFO|nr:hypothetical protein Cfor_00287 [Coptotermes formosanus]
MGVRVAGEKGAEGESLQEGAAGGPPLGMDWASLPGSAPVEEEKQRGKQWVTVVRRKGKRDNAGVARTNETVGGTQPMAVQTGGRGTTRRVRLPSPPRTAAVVVTLRPDAVARGVTYKEVLANAKAKVGLQDLGIEGVSCRPTAAGARIMEISGPCGGERADALAAGLREAVAEVAVVSRPTKRIDVRLEGLEDSVSEEEVVWRVSHEVGCRPEEVRAGPIRAMRRGIGAIFLSLPVETGRKLVEKGQVVVGWSVARICALGAKPLRCFKCMGLGHTRALCSAVVERGLQCFRCGVQGHKAVDCAVETPKCAVCADAGREDRHHMGGVFCRPPVARAPFSRVPP